MIDSHCHIGLNSSDVIGVLMRAQLAGVQSMLSVACYELEYPALLQLLNDYPNLYGAFGIHPEYVDTLPSADEMIAKITAHPRLVGFGEIGLDYHYLAHPKEVQRAAFEKQIEMAARVNKPIIIHAREADEDVIQILTAAKEGGLLNAGGVLHCYTSGPELAECAMDMGFYISASGVVTFKMSDNVREVFNLVPLDKLLIETDSPYLAPVPYRGKLNEPSYLVETAKKMAELKGVTLDEIDKITTANFKKLFQIKDSV